MSRKLTLDDMHASAAANDGYCLATSYEDLNTSALWRCKKGHEWSTSFGHIRGGMWCRKCKIRVSGLNRAREYAISRDGYCFSSEYVGVTSHLEWGCSQGHRWLRTFNGAKRAESWCTKCDVFIGPKNAQAIASTRGGRCLTLEFEGALIPLEWECGTHHRHRWKAPYKSIRAGHWCPFCGGVGVVTIEAAQKLALKFGGECLATTAPGSMKHIKWKCGRGHVWSAPRVTIYNGTWCQQCSKEDKLTKAREVATSKHGMCLNDEYALTTSHWKWECENKHIWMATYGSIVYQGSWCPTCHVSLTQRVLGRLIRDIFGTTIIHNYRKFSWLRASMSGTNTANMEVDIWLPELKIAIEYDGKQHFVPMNFGGDQSQLTKDKILKATQYRDRLKDRLIAEHPHIIKHFIRFNYKEKDLLTTEYVRNKLIKAGVII